jgi:hypothetical protein
MPLLSDLVIRTRQMMQSFSQEQQQWAYLTSPIGTTDVTLSVNDSTQISRGLIEIDGNELAVVKSVNRPTNTVTLDPFARGWAGTTAASHLTNARIENNPIWPAIRVKEAINDVIRSLYPDLFAVATTKITKISVQQGYSLPSDCQEIISVRFTTIGPTLINPPMIRYRFDGQADTTVFSTGKALWMGVDVTPGREIFVVYRKEPTELVNDTDDFAAVTGLPATAQDVVIYGACMKLAPALESPRLILDTVESSERAAYVQPGSAMRVSAAYGQLYMQRLMQERRKLNDRYQQPIHFTS